MPVREHPRRPLRSVFSRTVREQRRSWTGWVVGIVSFCLMMLSIYPTIRGNTAISKLIENYPAALRKIFNVADYTTSAGYLRAEVFSFIAPLLLALFAVFLGSDLIAGEEERRTIDLLLSTPVTRRRVMVEKWLALVMGTTLLGVVLALVIGVVGPLFHLHVGWVPLLAEVTGTVLFALFCGSLALGLGAATGSKGVARGGALAIMVAMYLVSALAQIVTALSSINWLSMWYHSLGLDPLGTGFHPWHLVIVVVVTVAVLSASTIRFESRDLAT